MGLGKDVRTPLMADVFAATVSNIFEVVTPAHICWEFDKLEFDVDCVMIPLLSILISTILLRL